MLEHSCSKPINARVFDRNLRPWKVRISNPNFTDPYQWYEASLGCLLEQRTTNLSCGPEKERFWVMKRHLKDISNHDEVDHPAQEPRSPDVRRRRVEMEKRRRDKINYYVNELTSLVPAAAQKKGCAKLEKAEVLELTVDHVRNVVNGNQASDRPPEKENVCAERERRRGFLACMQHISQFLEKSETFLECNEKLISSMKSFLSGHSYEGDKTQHSELRESIYDAYVSQNKEAMSSAGNGVTYENIFYKICMDFLKNNSVPRQTEERGNNLEKKEEQYTIWEAAPEMQNYMGLSFENFDSVDELTPPYGSFMTLLNSYY